MRVLYVNQTGQVSGAERSLLDLLRELPPDVEPLVACPDGPLSDHVAALGIERARIPATDASFRLHPLHTPRALAELAAQAAAVHRIARRAGADLVHANTTRAAIAAVGARRLGGPPVVAHVRDWVPPGRAAELTLRLVARGAALTVANSAFTAGQLPAGAGEVAVVHNPVDLRRFDRGAHDRGAARAALGLAPDDEVLAVVAQLTPWKGQQEAIEALRIVRRERPRAKLLLAGSAKFTAASTRFDNVAYARELERAAAAPDLAGAVGLLGERDDVEAVLAAVDVLLVPSWREAFGRIAAEALAMEVPVVATSVGGPVEIVRDGVDGVLLPPRQPDRWARAIAALLADSERRAAMGRAGAERVRADLGARAHAARIRDAYDAVLASRE